MPSMLAGRTIRVFASSPSDVSDERQQLSVVVQELNATLRALVPDRPTVVELIKWETYVHPDMGRDAQDVVSRQIPDYDVFLGIMWSRFGTPTKDADSGTEQEFWDAHAGWEKRRTPSHILFYFCRQDFPNDVVMKNIDQLQKVSAFRSELANRGLVWNYPSHAAFADTVRPHLVSVLSEILHAGQPRSEIAERTSSAASDEDLDLTRIRVKSLADEYESIRAHSRASDERTRRMEVVASQMRTLAQSAFPLLPELTASKHPGQRLAAIQVLQAVPDARWLDWLADRLQEGEETPFVGYHAAVALATAARDLEDAHLPLLRAALTRATKLASRLRSDTDRATTLAYADSELTRRESGGRSPLSSPPMRRGVQRSGR
jgi:Domain of unknown function (DUF4062)